MRSTHLIAVMYVQADYVYVLDIARSRCEWMEMSYLTNEFLLRSGDILLFFAGTTYILGIYFAKENILNTLNSLQLFLLQNTVPCPISGSNDFGQNRRQCSWIFI